MGILQAILFKSGRMLTEAAGKLAKTQLFEYTQDSEWTYAYGSTLVLDLISSGDIKINRVIAKEYPDDKEKLFDEALALAAEHNIPIEHTIMSRQPKGFRHGFSMAAEIEKPGSTILPGNHLMLVDPSLLRNAAAVFRTAVAFGINDIAVVLSEQEVDFCAPRYIRVSMGARLKCRVEVFRTFDEYIERFPQNTRYAFMLRNAEPLSEVAVEEPFTLIFGNETEGLPDAYADTCLPVFIEQVSAVDSLNLSNAASIGIYRFTRQR